MYVFNFVIFFLLKRSFVASVKPKIECGYKQCPQTREGSLNVHLIPHSHMDAGWVKTYDEYYFGAKTSVSTANVQLIYHSVLSELLHDKRRKFVLSETAYFWRWWKEQRPATRSAFRTLVQEGRVEFAGGGWVSNDEATVDYLQIIDQFTWGLRKLNDTLGPCGKPKAAWQIDNYGHTREQASLLAQMGFDGLFIGRVDYRAREQMIEEDRMEFMWRGSDVLGKMSDIMTHTLFNLYNAPEGFCFDLLCNDEPIVDDPDARVYNAEKRVSDFISQIERQAKYYDHDNIMVTMGGDFTYQSAANWFMNMDKLINHVNTHPANMSDINIFYSTPSCYLKAIYLFGRRDKGIYTEKDDLLPYGSDANTYWTGYYSSRLNLKYLAKRAHIYLQVMKQLAVITRMGDSYELHLLRHAVSLVLHHDAITGTSQQHVINDFIKTLSDAVEGLSKKLSNYLAYLTPSWGGSRRSKYNHQFVACHNLNLSECPHSETQDALLLLVYSPLSTKTYNYVRLPAVALHYTIRDPNDEEVEYQLVPLPGAVINLPGRSSRAIQELVFEAENIPPLGYNAYYISPIRDPLEENEFSKKIIHPDHQDQELTPYISNEYLKVTVNKETGLLESIQHVDGVSIQLRQNFYYYSQKQQAYQSGAYSFRPDKERPTPVTEKATYHAVRGNLVKELRQRFSDWITQVVRLYRGEEFVELEWIIGPVPIESDLGKEVVSIISSNVTNNGFFYTDSNGRLMAKRSCRNDTNPNQKKSIASCYYPVTSRLCILSQNSSTELCTLVDRPQGGTSYNEGEIELMVHRRLLTDDGFGLEEPLNEVAFGIGAVVRGKHRIVFGNNKQDVDELTFSERVAAAARRWSMEPWLFFTAGDKTNKRKWQNFRNKRFSALRNHGLPRHISILTLEPWKANSVLLRLENTLETDAKITDTEFPRTSTITVDISKIFQQMTVRAVRETTLAANQWLDDARQMDWSTRYIYSGGDDGINNEDMEFGEEKSGSTFATRDVRYSNEGDSSGQTYKRRRKATGLGRQKPRIRNKYNYDNYRRRKRSMNIHDNINENLINSSYELLNEFAKPTTKIPATTTINSDINEKSSLNFSNMTVNEYKARKAAKISKSSSGITRRKMKPNTFFDWAKDDISNEDIPTGIKKRSPRRRTTTRRTIARERIDLKKPQTDQDATDDGVTRSIYEMYYKMKPKINSAKPVLSSSEEYTEEPKLRRKPRKKPTRHNVNDYDNYDAHTTRRDERRIVDKVRDRNNMPLLSHTARNRRKLKLEMQSNKMETADFAGNSAQIDRAIPPRSVKQINTRRRRQDNYDEDDEYQDDEEGRDDSDEYRVESRKKRSAANSESGSTKTPEHPEMLVTLRATQIRTFIVWFEPAKKTYR